MVTVSVPGKLMLFGEHAVVYGYPCIVSTVNRYVQITIEKAIKKDCFITPEVKDTRFVRAALHEMRKRYGVRGYVSIKTKSDLGLYGLGSSSAVTVGLVRALSTLFTLHISNEACFDISYEAVASVQGKASGFDVASCIWGGTLLFDGKRKTVKPLTDQMLPIIVGYSGVKGDTKAMIDKVRQMKESQSRETGRIFRSIAKLVPRAARAVKRKDWQFVGKLMNTNHELLHQLGVSTRMLDGMVIAAYAAGAFGAKVSGAGGGDCVIAVVSEKNRNVVEKAIQRVGGEILDIKVGKSNIKAQISSTSIK